MISLHLWHSLHITLLCHVRLYFHTQTLSVLSRQRESAIIEGKSLQTCLKIYTNCYLFILLTLSLARTRYKRTKHYSLYQIEWTETELLFFNLGN